MLSILHNQNDALEIKFDIDGSGQHHQPPKINK